MVITLRAKRRVLFYQFSLLFVNFRHIIYILSKIIQTYFIQLYLSGYISSKYNQKRINAQNI